MISTSHITLFWPRSASQGSRYKGNIRTSWIWTCNCSRSSVQRISRRTSLQRSSISSRRTWPITALPKVPLTTLAKSSALKPKSWNNGFSNLSSSLYSWLDPCWTSWTSIKRGQPHLSHTSSFLTSLSAQKRTWYRNWCKSSQNKRKLEGLWWGIMRGRTRNLLRKIFPSKKWSEPSSSSRSQSINRSLKTNSTGSGSCAILHKKARWNGFYASINKTCYNWTNASNSNAKSVYPSIMKSCPVSLPSVTRPKGKLIASILKNCFKVTSIFVSVCSSLLGLTRSRFNLSYSTRKWVSARGTCLRTLKRERAKGKAVIFRCGRTRASSSRCWGSIT